MRITRNFFSSSVYCFVLILESCLAVQGFAQVDRASLNGTVTDIAGAVIPEIHVVLYMPDTGLARETDTSRSGTYEIAELPVGAYTVTFTGNGFATLTFSHVIQTVGLTRTLDAKMQLAGATQQITVTSLTAQLDKSTDELGARTESKQVQELPLNRRKSVV